MGAWHSKNERTVYQSRITATSDYYATSGFWVVFRKDTFNEQSLKELGLNDRQIKAVLYVKEKGRITNSEYQALNSVSKRTATNDLSELVEQYKILNRFGVSVETYYELK